MNVKNKRVYIAGSITLRKHEVAENHFALAAYALGVLGAEVVNPMELDHTANTEWIEFMRTDIPALIECDAILLLDGWVDSKGARVEQNLAEGLDLEEYHESDLYRAAILKIKTCYYTSEVTFQEADCGAANKQPSIFNPNQSWVESMEELRQVIEKNGHIPR